jgi:hypothetical protein
MSNGAWREAISSRAAKSLRPSGKRVDILPAGDRDTCTEHCTERSAVQGRRAPLREPRYAGQASGAEPQAKRPLQAMLGGASRLFGRQILVFHFPSVIQGVKGGVPNQESQGPFRHLTSQLAL